MTGFVRQLASREVPGYVNVLGTATDTATVSLWSKDNLALYTPTPRQGDYFRGEMLFNNNTGVLWLTITNVAVRSNYTGADIVTNTIGKLFMPKTAEVFGYDADGNLIRDGLWDYAWDAENRLVKQESLSGAPTASKLKLEFQYDSQGRRIQKLVSTNNGSIYVAQYTNRFVYDDWNLLAELDPSHSALRTYVWGLDLSGTLQDAGGVGGLLAITDASQGSHFCAYDGNGNVMALLKADGTGLTAQYEYGPFGEVLRATGAMAKTNPFRFSTKYQDDQSDYLYYGYRYYNPNTGRWLSRDPIGEAGGLNVYAFVVNDPLSFIDPLGDDFIAVSDRPVKGTLGLFYHYSVQYWISCDNPELNTEYDIEKWLKKNVAKKRESTELLADEGWKVWRLKGGTKWKLEDTKVSLIYYSDSGTKFAAIYKGTPQQVKQQWAKVIQQAKGYKYAEQPGFNGAFKNWPNSRYDVGDDVNNSNTYIRDIVKNSGMTMKELGGSHPGRNSPQPIPDDYGGQKPFKGPAPPQPPTPTPGP